MIALTRRKIRDHIVDHLLQEPAIGEDPLAAGQLDSLAVEQLLVYLEEEFDVSFADEELVVENFVSIAVLAELVESKRSTHV